MKKHIKRYFYVLLFIFILFGIVYISFTQIVLNNKIKEEIKNIQKFLTKEKKNDLKSEVKNIKYVFRFIKDSIYSITNEELLKLINVVIAHKIDKLYFNDIFVYGRLKKKLKYEIKDNFVFTTLNNTKYLVALGNKGKKIYIFGIKKEFLDNLLIYTFLKYLEHYNKGKISYVALGKITTFHPKKDGVFGYIYYMPDKFKFLEGKLLSINEPDIKGNFYRKKYFECLKENKGCFVSYFFKNPKTDIIEKKISYFDLIKDSNFSIVKGIYESQIAKDLRTKINSKILEVKRLVYTFFALFVIIYTLFLFFMFLFINKAKNILLNDFSLLENELINRVYFDKLTSLPNRNKLLEDIKDAKSLVILDIEDFSEINDIYGFEAGDKILINAAKTLKNLYKKVYRIGSDEFAIIFDEKINKDILENIVNLKIVYSDLLAKFIAGGSNCKKRLLESSELALKEAYRNNKDYILYDDSILKIQKAKVEKLKLLKEALDKKQIIPYYHCIVDKNKKVIKYEALMRVKIDDNVIVSPSFFMELIKEAKLYIPFSKIMMKKIFDDIKYLDKKVSINLSFEDIADREMREFILSLITKENAKKIIFEILESESIKDYKLVKKFMTIAKNKGVKVAIDDFGSGYSNFVQVLNLNPDIIKIDATLIKNIKEAKNYKLVSLIKEFAKTFNIKTTAEFVENEEIFSILKNLDIDEFQGYYFCKPQPFEKIIKKDKIPFKKGNNENRD